MKYGLSMKTVISRQLDLHMALCRHYLDNSRSQFFFARNSTSETSHDVVACFPAIESIIFSTEHAQRLLLLASLRVWGGVG
jgi:hypothetical protein